MKHTPGPWNTVSLSGERIAIVAHDATDIGNLSHATAANARLIAAAPDLLAALKRYHSIICANAIELDCDAAIELAKTVIAKAGE